MSILNESFNEWEKSSSEHVKHGNYDNTINGMCSECGDCCSNRLPMSQKEINQIKLYIKKNNIVEQKHGVFALSKTSLDLTCPFLDDTKKTHKCTIYPVRPQVCKEYICNCGKRFVPSSLVLDGKHHNILVRQTFFPK